MTEIKGFAVRGLFKFIKHSGHPGGIPAIVEKLPADVRGGLRNNILSSKWYPYPLFTSLLEVMDREIGRGEIGFMDRVGESAGSQDAGTVFKVVAVFTSTKRIVGYGPSFWKRYCDTGAFEVVESSDTSFHVALTDFPNIHRFHCQLVLGWVQGLGRVAGATGIQVKQVRCVHRRDARCEYKATWTKA